MREKLQVRRVSSALYAGCQGLGASFERHGRCARISACTTWQSAACGQGPPQLDHIDPGPGWRIVKPSVPPAVIANSDRTDHHRSASGGHHFASGLEPPTLLRTFRKEPNPHRGEPADTATRGRCRIGRPSPTPVVLDQSAGQSEERVSPVPVLTLVAQPAVKLPQVGHGGRITAPRRVQPRRGDEVHARGEQDPGRRGGRSRVGGGEPGGHVPDRVGQARPLRTS